MSCDFQLISLEQIGKIITGKTPPSKINDAFSSTINVPFITPKDMDGRRVIDSTERYLSDAGLESVQKNLIPAQAVCVSCIGSDMGKAVISHSPSVTNQQINTIVVDQERFDYRYIYYSLSTKQQELKDISGGSATPILNKGHFGKFEISIPTLEVQKKIADSLDCLDLKIELNRQINQTLEEMAQAIFKSWFVDFEPVKAKMQALENGGTEDDANLAAMQAISGKTADQLATLKTQHPDQYQQLHHTASLFPSAMQTTELGEIPVGWRVSEIGSAVTVVGGGTPSTKNPEFWDEGEIPWATPKDLSSLQDKILLDTDRKITSAGLAKISSGLLPENTVLLSSRAPVGYLALAKIPVAINQGFIAMKCENELPPEFILLWCQSEMQQIHNRASGTTFMEISKKNFNPIQIIVPVSSLINAFKKHSEKFFNAIESNSKENKTLTELRDTLLPKLLSGELQISTEDVAR